MKRDTDTGPVCFQMEVATVRYIHAASARGNVNIQSRKVTLGLELSH